MTWTCKYAYTQSGVRFLLCRKEGAVDPRDKKSYYHALCPNQRFCAKADCYQLTENAAKCLKLHETVPETRTEAAESPAPKKTVKSTAKKKSTKKVD